MLIPQLPRSPPDVEAMRIYLILSEYPALQDSKNYIRLTIPLAMAILRLDANPSKVLGIIIMCLATLHPAMGAIFTLLKPSEIAFVTEQAVI